MAEVLIKKKKMGITLIANKEPQMLGEGVTRRQIVKGLNVSIAITLDIFL